MLRLLLRHELLSLRSGLRFLKYERLFQKYHDFTSTRRILYYANMALVERYSEIPGVVVECGVWRGGMIAGLAEILGAQRMYYLFDNFEGMPPPQAIDGVRAKGWHARQMNPNTPGYLANFDTDEAYAHQAMKRAGAPHYQIVKGWFEQTLSDFQPSAPIAILRLDAGWYEATITCLKALYPHVIPGGIIIFDDYYGWDGAAKALHEYLAQMELADHIYQFDNRLCYVVKMTGDAEPPE